MRYFIGWSVQGVLGQSFPNLALKSQILCATFAVAADLFIVCRQILFHTRMLKQTLS